jgi:glycosyltransferase involved in cell wall biosynthesis
VQRLAATHEVHLLVVRRFGKVKAQDPDDHRGLSVARYYELAPTPNRTAYASALVRQCLGSWRRGRWSGSFGPRHEWAFVTPAVRRHLRDWFVGQTFDRIICYRLQTGDYARFFLAEGLVRPPGLELDLDDIESITRRSIAAGLMRRGRWWDALKARCHARRAARREAEALQEFGCIHVCSSDDAAQLALRQPAARIEVMPNRLAHLPDRMPAGDPHCVVFVGTLNYFPNEDAVLFFAKEVLPALRAHSPAWRLLVAGRGAPLALQRRLSHCPGVEFRGAVQDVAELYRPAGLVVAPVQAGGGTKIKVLEALGYGRPLVATSHAAYGLGLADGVHFLQAKTPSEWVAACRRLAEDPELGARLGTTGRERIRGHFVAPSPSMAPAPFGSHTQ